MSDVSHPFEYRPPSYEFAPNRAEVVIARLSLNSSNQDVYSVLARQLKDRIAYRIVDEYDGSWSCQPRTSKRPLTLRQIIDLIDTAECHDMSELPGGVGGSLTNELRDGAAYASGVEAGAEFVDVSSDFYPELTVYYEAEAKKWFEQAREIERVRAEEVRAARADELWRADWHRRLAKEVGLDDWVVDALRGNDPTKIQAGVERISAVGIKAAPLLPLVRQDLVHIKGSPVDKSLKLALEALEAFGSDVLPLLQNHPGPSSGWTPYAVKRALRYLERKLLHNG